jgi:hypothetical protein
MDGIRGLPIKTAFFVSSKHPVCASVYRTYTVSIPLLNHSTTTESREFEPIIRPFFGVLHVIAYPDLESTLKVDVVFFEQTIASPVMVGFGTCCIVTTINVSFEQPVTGLV